MFDISQSLWLLGTLVVVVPALLVAALGLTTLAGRPCPEHLTSRLVQAAMTIGLLAACGVLAMMLATGKRHVPIHLGNWVEIAAHEAAAPETTPHAPMVHGESAESPQHFHFAFKFTFDRLSVPFVILTFLLCGVIGAFASKYLHREPGFNRFFVLYALFALGMVLTSLAGTIETLFTGWELVGVSSALLVAFFHERPGPVDNGLRVWAVYRFSDAALLLAAVVMHHMRGAGDFDTLLGATPPWPESHSELTSQQALIVGSLLLVAAAGKSALVPFSGWLPRAMEGPTPSSAIFYGALSAHLGAFLLLRVSPLLDLSLGLSIAVVLLGLSTAIFASLAGRAQSDIKSALSFAALTQVGLIVAEIGLGLRYLALVHILGHASLRTLQFLRASSLLQDYRMMEDAIGSRLPGRTAELPLAPARSRTWLYRLAIGRGYLDLFLADYIAQPILRTFRACDALERRWTDLLTRGPSRESDELAPGAGSLKEPL
ncbi:MAG: oxidoreductase [Planctomycetaceae bacterium]|nr:oxidoreductase [Planctomycetaceae bacterium]